MMSSKRVCLFAGSCRQRWRLTGDVAPRNFVAIGVFQQIFDDNKSFVPLFSFYDLGHKFNAKAISKDQMSQKAEKDLGMFYHSSQTSDFEDRGHSSFKNLVEKVLKNYLG